MRMLFQRDTFTRPSNDIKKNFLDHSEMAPDIFAYIGHIGSGLPLENAIKFKTEDGTLYDENYTIGLEYKAPILQVLVSSMTSSSFHVQELVS